jgi:MFS transporter, DHA2 family, multidrug resistance protein
VTVAIASATPDGRVSGSFAPYVGLLGVLLGTMMSTLDTRVTVFGLADLRGALDTGFGEGAWITTLLGIGQLIGGICCPYLATVIGPRRMLLGAILVFFVATVLAPFSPNLRAYLVAEFLGGLGSGTFIPLTIIFILRHIPKGLMVYGLAICDELRVLTEYRSFAGRLLHGPLVLALDRRAVRTTRRSIP